MVPRGGDVVSEVAAKKKARLFEPRLFI